MTAPTTNGAEDHGAAPDAARQLPGGRDDDPSVVGDSSITLRMNSTAPEITPVSWPNSSPPNAATAATRFG
jgi:hypothetical protein